MTERPYNQAHTMPTYVLDTSVLLSDPSALTKFAEHPIVLPVVVIDELEHKRRDPILGHQARTVLRQLDGLRGTYGQLTDPVPVNDIGGTVRIELNHQDQATLPPSLRGSSNDHRILTVAHHLAVPGDGEGASDVIVVTKDLPLRIRASLAGIEAQTYRNTQAIDTSWTGLVRCDTCPDGIIDELYEHGEVTPSGLPPAVQDMPAHTCLILTDPTGRSALARLHPDRHIRLCANDPVAGIRGRSAEQRLALDLLADPNIGVVSMAGPAGTGKTILALAAALDSVRLGHHERVIVLRSVHTVGNEKLGFLPGTVDDKIAPSGQAVRDALDALVGSQRARRLLEDGTVQVMPLSYLRGRTVAGAVTICDDSQNVELPVIATLLGRAGGPAGTNGRGYPTRIFFTHDVSQCDNPMVGRTDGILAAVERLTGHPLFAHIDLVKTERSEVAKMAGMLDMGT